MYQKSPIYRRLSNRKIVSCELGSLRLLASIQQFCVRIINPGCALERPTKGCVSGRFWILKESCEARCQTRFGLNLAVLALSIKSRRLRLGPPDVGLRPGPLWAAVVQRRLRHGPPDVGLRLWPPWVQSSLGCATDRPMQGCVFGRREFKCCIMRRQSSNGSFSAVSAPFSSSARRDLHIALLLYEFTIEFQLDFNCISVRFQLNFSYISFDFQLNFR